MFFVTGQAHICAAGDSLAVQNLASVDGSFVVITHADTAACVGAAAQDAAAGDGNIAAGICCIDRTAIDTLCGVLKCAGIQNCIGNG